MERVTTFEILKILYWENLEEGIFWCLGQMKVWCEGCVTGRKAQSWHGHGDFVGESASWMGSKGQFKLNVRPVATSYVYPA